jgi:predicted dithiol-disulfide oxidoreductase (DUF899 family)
MTKHMTGTRKEWLAARLELLETEKELTRRSVGPDRQGVSIRYDKGSVSLADLFRGRSQLLVYHFMVGTDYTAGCPSCSAIADGYNGFVVHLANHDVMLSAVLRAPLAKLQAYKRRMGWRFPWASSLGGDFNFDFNVSFTEERQREGASNTTTGARRLSGARVRRVAARGRRPSSRPCAEPTRPRTIAIGRASARSRSRTASSTTPIPPMRADWTASGACTSGSTAPPRGATRRASGGGHDEYGSE